MRFKDKFKYCPACGSTHFEENNEKSKCCADCGFVLYENSSAAVAAFILNDKNELLVCKRAKEPAKGTYDLPGGFVDGNETAEQAIAREIKEELGAEVALAEYKFSLPNTYLFSDLHIPTLDMFFHCKLKNNDKLTAADDVAECFYLPPEKIKSSDFGLDSISRAIDIFLQSNITFPK